MTAPKTNVFCPQTARLINRDVVTEHHTSQGMSDHLEICLCFKERVSASAGVFSCLRVFFDYVNAMTHESTDIVDFLFEFAMVGIRVGTHLEEQRVSASFTDVLIMLCPLTTGDVAVPAEKARKRMSDARARWAMIKNCCTASDARRAGFTGNSRVIDFVA